MPRSSYLATPFPPSSEHRSESARTTTSVSFWSVRRRRLLGRSNSAVGVGNSVELRPAKERETPTRRRKEEQNQLISKQKHKGKKKARKWALKKGRREIEVKWRGKGKEGATRGPISKQMSVCFEKDLYFFPRGLLHILHQFVRVFSTQETGIF